VSKPTVDHPSRIFNPICNFVVPFTDSPLFLLVERKSGSGSLSLLTLFVEIIHLFGRDDKNVMVFVYLLDSQPLNAVGVSA
jgi:hypothetical protein